MALLFSLIVTIIIGQSLEDSAQNRIIDGTDCNILQFPFIVQIQIIHIFVCGGILIEPEWVLTAAHCCHKVPPRFIDIVAGSTTSRVSEDKLPSGAELITVKHIFFHPEYSIKPYKHDIALLRLKRPFKMSKSIKLARLPTSNFTENCSGVLAFGWGDTHSPKSFEEQTDILQCGFMSIVKDDICMWWWADLIKNDPSVLCVSDPFLKVSPCLGDSGGPLICNSTVIGLTSWGSKLCQPGVPAVYVRIDYYSDFIKKVLANNLAALQCTKDGLFVFMVLFNIFLQ